MDRYFREFLKEQGLGLDTVELLLDEGFESRADLNGVTAETLRAIGLKGKAIAQVLKISCLTTETEKHESDKEEEDDSDSIHLGNSDSSLESDEEREKELSFYFSAQEFKELSCYDKISMHNLLLRYKRALETPGVNAEQIKPKFVIDYERKRKEEERIKAKLQSQAPGTAENQRQHDTPGPSNALPPMVLRTKSSSGNASQPASTRKKTTGFDQLSPTEISAINPTLPEYDVLGILTTLSKDPSMENDERFKSMFLELQQEGLVDGKHRKQLMRVLARFLHKDMSDIKEVTPKMKEGIAKSLLVAFPKFCGPKSDERTPWHHIFDGSNKGFLANACRPFQKKNRQRNSKKKNSEDTPNHGGESGLDTDGVEDLALLIPDRANKAEILNLMSQSFRNRCALRKRGAFLKDILREFPHFTSYDGEVINAEFARMQPNAKDMCRSFLKLLPNILKLTPKHSVSPKFNDDIVRALLLLSQHLAHDIPQSMDPKSSGSCWAEEKDIFSVLQNGDDVQDFVTEKLNNSKVRVQPYLIVVTHGSKGRVLRTFLVLDDKPMQLASCPTVKALDWLFQAHFVFNARYALGWRNTFHFLATCFYEIFEKIEGKGKKRDAVTPQEVELWNKLISVGQS